MITGLEPHWKSPYDGPMQGTDTGYPRLGDDASARDCAAWLRKVTRWIGPGFHPENPGEQYVALDENGGLIRSFSPALCELLDADLDRCYAVLEPLGKDPCSIAIKVQRRLIAGRSTG